MVAQYDGETARRAGAASEQDRSSKTVAGEFNPGPLGNDGTTGGDDAQAS